MISTRQKKLAVVLAAAAVVFVAYLVVHACTIEDNFQEYTLDQFVNTPVAIVIGKPIRFSVDSVNYVVYINFQVEQWLKGTKRDSLITLKQHGDPIIRIGSGQRCSGFPVTADCGPVFCLQRYYLTPLYYYCEGISSIDSSWLNIPLGFDIFRAYDHRRHLIPSLQRQRFKLSVTFLKVARILLLCI